MNFGPCCCSLPSRGGFVSIRITAVSGSTFKLSSFLSAGDFPFSTVLLSIQGRYSRFSFFAKMFSKRFSFAIQTIMRC